MSFFFMTKSCTGILFTWKDNLIITSYRKRLEMLMWMSIYDRHDVVVKVLVYLSYFQQTNEAYVQDYLKLVFIAKQRCRRSKLSVYKLNWCWNPQFKSTAIVHLLIQMPSPITKMLIWAIAEKSIKLQFHYLIQFEATICKEKL